jgi:hypothetical protein
MAHFEATVRIFDVSESNASTARRVIEDRLRTAGFSRWKVARIAVQGTMVPRADLPRRVMRTDASYVGGGMLIAAVVAWTLWFLWLLAS